MGNGGSRQNHPLGGYSGELERGHNSRSRKRTNASGPLDMFGSRKQAAAGKGLGVKPLSPLNLHGLAPSSVQLRPQDSGSAESAMEEDCPATPKFLADWQHQLAELGSLDDGSSCWDDEDAWMDEAASERHPNGLRQPRKLDPTILHALEKIVLANYMDGEIPPELYFEIDEAEEEYDEVNDTPFRLCRSCPMKMNRSLQQGGHFSHAVEVL